MSERALEKQKQRWDYSMPRVYSPKTYRETHYTLQAIDRLGEKYQDWYCDCDLDYICPKHEYIHSVAIRYGKWKGK